MFGKNTSSFQKQLIVAYLETRLNMFYGELKTYLFPPSVKFIVIHCGTNNLDCNDPIDIAKGILNIGKSLLEKAPKSNIILTGIVYYHVINLNLREEINYAK